MAASEHAPPVISTPHLYLLCLVEKAHEGVESDADQPLFMPLVLVC